MKSFIISITFFLSACSSLGNGAKQLQPVELVDPKTKTWFTTCSGAVESWSNCQSKAHHTCQNGYEIVNRNETTVGGKRELTFVCK